MYVLAGLLSLSFLYTIFYKWMTKSLIFLLQVRSSVSLSPALPQLVRVVVLSLSLSPSTRRDRGLMAVRLTLWTCCVVIVYCVRLTAVPRDHDGGTVRLALAARIGD
jgi:hypothetical protein